MPFTQGFTEAGRRTGTMLDSSPRRGEKQRRASELLEGCGHELCPHPIDRVPVPGGVNRFDFEQLK